MHITCLLILGKRVQYTLLVKWIFICRVDLFLLKRSKSFLLGLCYIAVCGSYFD